MPYVERDAEGAIKGVYANRQPGYAEEFVADAVLPLPAPVLDQDTLNAILLEEGSVLRAISEIQFRMIKGTVLVTPSITVAQYRTLLKNAMRTIP